MIKNKRNLVIGIVIGILGAACYSTIEGRAEAKAPSWIETGKTYMVVAGGGDIQVKILEIDGCWAKTETPSSGRKSVSKLFGSGTSQHPLINLCELQILDEVIAE